MPKKAEATVVIQNEADLESLLKPAREIPKQDGAAADIQDEDDLDNLLKQYGSIRHLSSGLQSLIRRQWSCSYSFYSHHVSRLFLEPDWKQKRVFWLLETTGQQGHAVLNNRCLFGVESQALGLLTPVSMSSKTRSEIQTPSQKRPRTSVEGPPRTIGNAHIDGGQSADSQSLCQQLEGRAASPCAEAAGQVDDYKARERFSFEAKDLGSWSGYAVSSATELFSQPVDGVSNRERVQLALALLKATLINHSTPAWPKGCVFEATDILKKPGAPVILSDALGTLNLQVQVGGPGDDDMDIEDGSVASEEELRETYGIQNQVLYRLGVALLSIGL
ncbi:uncharacterized protein P884DRAFT_296837 [Thermothelomyces heterothallicus CBS 202.75]|uniref:uncharacterized protein n=1 Tax=Thermothelomyces heterothallicus CBS 202.75 TaxID=1149848 RepID=UPI003743DF00